MNRFTYTLRELIPGVEALERTMGYRPGTAPEPVTLLINELTEELLPLVGIKAEYRLFTEISLLSEQRKIQVEDVIFNVKPIIYSQIKKAEEIALFTCTAGPEIGAMSHHSMKNGDLLRGYIYDVIGSEVVETAADRMQYELKERMAMLGKKITNRFSPGYCGWDVAEQHKLFSFFKDNFCGITLTESALMNPVKSVSGIIGIGSDVRYSPYQCKLCDDKNCLYRRKGL
ncbi:MAG: methionine synthase [Bacteroidales bacterium]|nr:methionine synthase [Bacteroidales bacterium]